MLFFIMENNINKGITDILDKSQIISRITGRIFISYIPKCRLQIDLSNGVCNFNFDQ